MVQLQRKHLQDLETWQTAEIWVKGLIGQLLQITHYQWLLQHVLIHYHLQDGQTHVQRKRLVEQTTEIMWVDPDGLLSEDTPLLGKNFEKLGVSGPESSQPSILGHRDGCCYQSGCI